MASSLIAKTIEETLAGVNNLDLAEFRSVNNKLSPNTGGQGSVLSVSINKPAKTWVGTSAVPDDYQQDQEKKVNVVLNNHSAYRFINTTERSTDLIDETEQVYKNLNAGVQLLLKKRFYNCALSSANFALNGSAMGGYPVQMSDLGTAVAAVKTFGLADKISCLIPELSMAALNGSASTRFYSPKKQDEIFDNNLGSFAGADILTTIVNGTHRAAPGLPAATSAASLDGDTFITVPATTQAIPAGTMFTIDGVYACDLEGNPIVNPQTGAQVLASFATPIDIPAGATAIPLGKSIFFNGTSSTVWQNRPNFMVPFSNGEYSVGGGVSFVSALPASGAAITQINANKRSMVIYGDRALAVATATPATTDTVYEKAISDYGVGYKFYRQGSVDKGGTAYRIDAIAGFSGVYTPACVTLLY